LRHSLPAALLLLLLIVQFPVIAIAGKQVGVPALFYDFAIVDYEDIIKIKEGKDPVCYDDGSLLLKKAVKVTDDLIFCFCVHGTQAIIKYHHMRVFYQGPRN
jgi:hypothetical protein